MDSLISENSFPEGMNRQHGVEEGDGFKYTVSLTRTSDGRTVQFTKTWDYPGYTREEDWEHDPVFLWAEGNYSCNCNRFLFFERACGSSETEIKTKDPNKGESGSCNDYENYRVNWIRNEETKNLIYSEPKEHA
jgi:hypothetical protein